MALLTRGEAIRILEENVRRRNIFLHMLAVEAIMRGLAKRLGGDEELWGLTGLLHDVDFDRTAEDFERHGLEAASILGDSVPREVLDAIRAHNSKIGEPRTPMENALVASDAASGLIIACALVMPSKRLEEVTLEGLIRKFKDKDFARGADRDRILFCERLGLSRDEFLRIALDSLKSIAPSLGL
ncbi:MAG: HDIG domain-containing protein [Candidatus Bathyarchaeia archaeon]